MKNKQSRTDRASLELLYEISREFAAALDLRTVLRRVLSLSMKDVEAVSGSIVVLDDNGQPIETAFLMSGKSYDRSTLQLRLTYEQGLAGWVVRNRQSALVMDTSQDERWLRRPDDSVERTGPKSAVSVPILMRDKLVGVITLVRPKVGLFTPDHLELVQAIADQAGIAILNARLYTESQHQAQEMTAIAESLRVAHKRYHDLFEDSIDPILITNWKGRILETNRRAELMTGLEREKLLSLNIDGLHPIDHGKVGANFAKLRSGETICYESFMAAGEGQTIPVQVYARSIVSDDVKQLQWIFRDMTERNNLDNLREDLTASIYHDLRSPLMNIVSSLEALAVLLASQQEPSALPLLEIASRSTYRIQRLTDSLLDIGRLEAGQVIGKRISMSPLLLASDSLEVVLPALKNKELEYTVDVPLDLPNVSVDADMIRRVLINLLENAVKFTPSGGKIWVGARRDAKFVQMWVKDSGPGISPADQERIFDKFVRLNVAGKPRGFGLGLAFCRLAVVGHGGRVWVESQAGAGSSFHFTLPVAIENGP